MREYLQSRWVRVGLGLFIFGCGPLILIIVAAAIGLWPDPIRIPSVQACLLSSRSGRV